MASSTPITFNKATASQLDATKPTLYIHFASPPSRAIYLILKQLNVLDRVNVYEVDVLTGEMHTPEYLAINPFHTIPALSHNGLNLFESTAILEYLNEILQLNQIQKDWGFAAPTTKDSVQQQQKYAQINVLHKYHNLIPPASRGFTASIYASVYTGVPYDVEATRQGIINAKTNQYQILEDLLKRNGGWVVPGNKPTAVDILYGMELYQLSYDPEYTNWTWGVIDFNENNNGNENNNNNNNKEQQQQKFPTIAKWLIAIRDAIVIPNADIFNTHVAGFGQFVGEKVNNQHKLALLAAEAQQKEEISAAAATATDGDDNNDTTKVNA